MKKGYWQGNKREFLGASVKAIASYLLLSGSSCQPRQGNFVGFFRVNNFACNKLRATQDETLTLSWEYGRENLLKKQKLRFLRLHLSGIAPEVVDLELGQRSFQFSFNGPIIVELQAMSSSSVDDSRPFSPDISAALEVKKLQDLFFRASFSSSSNTPLFPYLGYPQRVVVDNSNIIKGVELVNSNQVDFTQFIGFFDSNENGTIEPLANIFNSTEAFRGLSISGIQAQFFGFKEGPKFPFQLFNNPKIGRTNAMIFAGAIVMSGEARPYKAEDGEGTFRTTALTGQGADTKPLGFDPIFVAIPLLLSGKQVTLADIQLGNLKQKLVTTVFTNPLLTSQTSQGQINTLTVDLESSLSTGNIKGATSGITITPNSSNNNTPFDATVFIGSIEWRTEFIKDEQLLDVITIGNSSS